MKRALGKKCEPKYKSLEYFYKSGKSGLLFATDAHICLAAVDDKLPPGYYDRTCHPVPKGDWLACDVDAMFEAHRRAITQISDTMTRIDKYYLIGDCWLFTIERVDLLKEWIGKDGQLFMSDLKTLYGASNDGKRMGIVCHEDKRVYKVGPSVFLTEGEARNFAAMIGVDYV